MSFFSMVWIVAQSYFFLLNFEFLREVVTVNFKSKFGAVLVIALLTTIILFGAYQFNDEIDSRSMHTVCRMIGKPMVFTHGYEQFSCCPQEFNVSGTFMYWYEDKRDSPCFEGFNVSALRGI